MLILGNPTDQSFNSWYQCCHHRSISTSPSRRLNVPSAKQFVNFLPLQVTQVSTFSIDVGGINKTPAVVAHGLRVEIAERLLVWG